MLRLVTFDVETACFRRGSLCQWAAARFDPDGRVVTTSSLVNPGKAHFFQQRHVEVHGITHLDVKTAPTPPDAWDRLSRALAWPDLVVAHNSPFDSSVVRAVAEEWDLPLPDTDVVCSVQLARKVWPQAPSKSLGKLTAWLGLPAFSHHDAEADAAATLRLVAAAADEVGCEVDEVFDRVGVKRKPLSRQPALVGQ